MGRGTWCVASILRIDAPATNRVAASVSGPDLNIDLQRKDNVVSKVDKVKNKMQEAKGRLKEAAGKATGDHSLEAKGKRDQAAGDLKQAGEHVKDAIKR